MMQFNKQLRYRHDAKSGCQLGYVLSSEENDEAIVNTFKGVTASWTGQCCRCVLAL